MYWMVVVRVQTTVWAVVFLQGQLQTEMIELCYCFPKWLPSLLLGSSHTHHLQPHFTTTGIVDWKVEDEFE